MPLQIRSPFDIEFLLRSKLFRILALAQDFLSHCVHEGLRPKDNADRRIEAARQAAGPSGSIEVDFVSGSAAIGLCVISQKITLALGQPGCADGASSPARASAVAVSAFLQELALLSPGACLTGVQTSMAAVAMDLVAMLEHEFSHGGPAVACRYPVHAGVRAAAPMSS